MNNKKQLIYKGTKIPKEIQQAMINMMKYMVSND